MANLKKLKHCSLSFFIFLLFQSISFSSSLPFVKEAPYERDRNEISGFKQSRGITEDTPINVLSIDGGGVRGIIPAIFLKKLEEETKCRTIDLFDLTAGTSTGAILSIGLTSPIIEPKIEWSKKFRTANDMIKIYTGMSKGIFPPYIPGTYYGGLIVPSCFFWGSEYSEEPLERELNRILGDIQLRELPVPTVVTSVNAELHTLRLFRSYRAPWKEGENFFVRDVARATSAAPTYFPIKKIRPINKDGSPVIDDELSLVDGGMAANNPAAIALAEAYNLFGQREVNLISLGTGEDTDVRTAKDIIYVRRAKPTIDMLMDSQSNTIHQTLTGLSQSIKSIKYKRVQIQLPEKLLDMSCASNVGKLWVKADNYFENEGKEQLADISELLKKTLDGRNGKSKL